MFTCRSVHCAERYGCDGQLERFRMIERAMRRWIGLLEAFDYFQGAGAFVADHCK